MIDQSLLTAVQYALLEPPNGGLSYESGLWTFGEMIAALDQQQQHLLKVTHLQVGLAEIPGVIGQARYTLPDDWLATVAVLWDQTTAGVRRVREVCRADMHQADLGNSGWEATNGEPQAYSDADTPTRTLQLMPAPAATGTIQVVYVPRAQPPDGAGEPLQVPDEWCTPVLKYGVLAKALSKVGRAHDPTRAGYCAWRMRLGEDVTRLLLDGMG